ncbi:MAG: hypothetical protein ACLGPM_08720 [Acidobacteriota bacterium]
MPSSGPLTLSPGPRMKTALAVAILADILQLAVLPLVVEGAMSPADDLLDLGVAGVLASLLGWHWELLPSFAGKLVPGLDMAPLWTLAVANVYRKSKASATASAATMRNASQPRQG